MFPSKTTLLVPSWTIRKGSSTLFLSLRKLIFVRHRPHWKGNFQKKKKMEKGGCTCVRVRERPSGSSRVSPAGKIDSRFPCSVLVARVRRGWENTWSRAPLLHVNLFLLYFVVAAARKKGPLSVFPFNGKIRESERITFAFDGGQIEIWKIPRSFRIFYKIIRKFVLKFQISPKIQLLNRWPAKIVSRRKGISKYLGGNWGGKHVSAPIFLAGFDCLGERQHSTLTYEREMEKGWKESNSVSF